MLSLWRPGADMLCTQCAWRCADARCWQKALSSMAEEEKGCADKINLITGILLPALKGFHYPIFSKCHHGNAWQAVYAIVLGGDLLFVHGCRRRFGVRAGGVGPPAEGNAWYLGLRQSFSCSNGGPGDKYTLFDTFKCLASWPQST